MQNTVERWTNCRDLQHIIVMSILHGVRFVLSFVRSFVQMTFLSIPSGEPWGEGRNIREINVRYKRIRI